MSSFHFHSTGIQYSRKSFLKKILLAKGISFFTFSFFLTNTQCQTKKTPKLRGISNQEYHNIHAIGDIFLKDHPITNFDIGKAMDDYIYGHPHPLENQSQLHELASLPSSLAASLMLDTSFQTLSDLNREDREKRLLAWKQSNSALKRGLYNLFHSFCFFLLGTSHAYLVYTKYKNEK